LAAVVYKQAVPALAAAQAAHKQGALARVEEYKPAAVAAANKQAAEQPAYNTVHNSLAEERIHIRHSRCRNLLRRNGTIRKSRPRYNYSHSLTHNDY